MLAKPAPGRSSQMATVLVAVLATSCLTVEAKLPWQIMLDKATYTIKSELVSTLGHIHIEEFHSAHQRRSRLNYRIDSGLPAGFTDTKGSFIADDMGAYEMTRDKCRSVRHKAVGEALSIDMLDDKASAPHVIGAARLLLAITRNSDQFKPAIVGGVQSAETFEAEIGQYKVTLSNKGAGSLALGVPPLVLISKKGSNSSIQIKTQTVSQLRTNELLLVGGSGLPSLRQPNNDSELMFDLFALERAHECTRDHNYHKIDATENNHPFSFNAKLVLQAEWPVDMVVGYEPELATLRVDQAHLDSWSRSLTNYKQDRRYSIRRASGGGQWAPDDVFDNIGRDVSCVVTRAMPNYDMDTRYLAFMLFGVSQMAYLGMARVRGIDAYVYEAYDSKLPIWLDTPTVYETPKGELERRAGPLLDDKFARKLTTVLYFDKELSVSEDKGIADKKLLLVEVFRENSTHGQDLLYQIPIYEFSWDIRPTAPNGKRVENFSSLADMCPPVTLKYLGRSRDPLWTPSDKFPGIPFQRCFELAAHQHRDTLLAYQDAGSICLIQVFDRETTNSESGAKIQLDSLGSFELYQTFYRAQVELDHKDRISELEDNSKTDTSRLALVDPSQTNSSARGDTHPPANSKTNHEIEHLNENVPYDLDDHHLADINKFPGLGLIAGDAQNKLIEPKQVSDGQMTFEQCQEACLLIDVECKAYSTCVVAGKVECILSSVDLRVPTTVKDLLLLRDKKSKLGEISEVVLHGGEVDTQAVESSSIHIKKHPTCELHNKLYQDVFIPAGVSKVSLKDRHLRPVSHLEQCAELCFLGTLATMREEVRRTHKTVHEGSDSGLTESYSHCSHYFYLDANMLERSQIKIPAEQISGINTDDLTRGYCLLDDGSTGDAESSVVKEKQGEQSNPAGSSVIFELRKFELDFSFLYEKAQNVSLAKSTKTPDEELAYKKILANEDYTSEQLDLMREFTQAGGNTARMVWTSSAHSCARMCFTQQANLWPACRSFDYIEEKITRTGENFPACYFNSMTVKELRDLGKSELVRENNTQDLYLALPEFEIQVWHYEPRQGLAASSLEQLYQVSIGQSQMSFGLMLTICFVMTAGFALGVRMRSRLEIQSILSRTGLAYRHYFRDDTHNVDLPLAQRAKRGNT